MRDLNPPYRLDQPHDPPGPAPTTSLRPCPRGSTRMPGITRRTTSTASCAGQGPSASGRHGRPRKVAPDGYRRVRMVFNRPAYVRGLALLIVLALLIAAVVAVGIGSRRPLPPPFGLAQNGAVIASADGDILAVDPNTGRTSPLIADGSFDFGPSFSRDGTKFLFLRDPDGPDVHTGLVVAHRRRQCRWRRGTPAATPLVIGPRLGARLVARWRADRFPVATKGRRHGVRDQRRERRRERGSRPSTWADRPSSPHGFRRMARRSSSAASVSTRGGSATGDLGRAPGWNRGFARCFNYFTACQRR